MELADQLSQVNTGSCFGQGRDLQRASQSERALAELDWNVQARHGTRNPCFADHSTPITLWIPEAATSRIYKESVTADKTTDLTGTMGWERHHPRRENPRQRLSITHHQQVVGHDLDSSCVLGESVDMARDRPAFWPSPIKRTRGTGLVTVRPPTSEHGGNARR